MRLLLLGLLGLAAFARAVAQVTETPQTVAPGKILVEMDGLRLSFDRGDEAEGTHSAVGILSTILSTGLTADLDLQVGVDVFLRESFTLRGRKDSTSGLGDVSLRAKWTFWRDSKTGQAVAVIPFARLPSGSSAVAGKAAGGGIIVPWAMNAGAGVIAGAMLHWDMVRSDADNGYDSHWLASAFAERALTSTIAVYGEAILASRSTSGSNWAGTIGAGARWRLNQRLELDYELQRGVNRAATDWTHTWRVNWEW
jgi:hypothetical protein